MRIKPSSVFLAVGGGWTVLLVAIGSAMFAFVPAGIVLAVLLVPLALGFGLGWATLTGSEEPLRRMARGDMSGPPLMRPAVALMLILGLALAVLWLGLRLVGERMEGPWVLACLLAGSAAILGMAVRWFVIERAASTGRDT